MATAPTRKFRPRQWRAPARLLALTVTLILSLAQQASASTDFRDRSVIGTWKLVSVLDLASIASLDEAEAKTLVGKLLTISETAVKVDGETCAAPEFWAERVAPEPHMLEKLHASAKRLRLPNPVTMVELGCTDVYIRNAGQLVLLWGGAMFDAVRINHGARAGLGLLPVGKQAMGKTAARKAAVTARPTAPAKVQQADMLIQSVNAARIGKSDQPRSITRAGRDRPPTTTRKYRKSPTRKTGVKAPGPAFVNELF